MKKLLILFLIFTINSCVSRVDKRGYMFDLSGHESLQEGVTTKDNLIKIMGSPTLISDSDQSESWIYYAEEVKYLLFFKPEIVGRDVLIVSFDEENVIKDLSRINLSDENKLDFVDDVTKVESHKEEGLFKSLFNNIGTVKSQ